jgi:hypothetical protein
MEGRNGNINSATRQTAAATNVKGGDDDEFNGEDVDLLYAPVVNHPAITTTTTSATATATRPVQPPVRVNTASSLPSFVSPSDVQSLIEMGFNKEEAVDALTRSKGNMVQALEKLTEDS